MPPAGPPPAQQAGRKGAVAWATVNTTMATKNWVSGKQRTGTWCWLSHAARQPRRGSAHQEGHDVRLHRCALPDCPALLQVGGQVGGQVGQQAGQQCSEAVPPATLDLAGLVELAANSSPRPPSPTSHQPTPAKLAHLPQLLAAAQLAQHCIDARAQLAALPHWLRIEAWGRGSGGPAGCEGLQGYRDRPAGLGSKLSWPAKRAGQQTEHSQPAPHTPDVSCGGPCSPNACW